MATFINRRVMYRLAAVAAASILFTFLLLQAIPYRETWDKLKGGHAPSGFDWEHRKAAHPIAPGDIIPLPTTAPIALRRIQHDFSKDPKDEAHEKKQAERRKAVKEALTKSWDSYRKHAWGHDELKPESLAAKDSFSGWGATLVDTLDTLWIMDLKQEFKDAVEVVADINWDNSTAVTCSIFETNIRYLGGLLSAYELSGEKTLLNKALELGYLIYAAFDTPNHMPVGTLNFDEARAGGLVASDHASLAALGTLSMELTRLAQLTNQPKFFDGIERIKQNLVRTQDQTQLPGMWPTNMDLSSGFDVKEHSFTLGASADSGYEYLPKMYALLGGRDASYKDMHTKAMETARKHLVFRAMIPTAGEGKAAPDVLFTGTVSSYKDVVDLKPEIQHLGCFAGGHFALGGRLFDLEDHVRIGEQIARGCGWAYGATPTGIMPENGALIPCGGADDPICEWNETMWEKEKGQNVPDGFHAVRDARYYLRPEAVESIYILYRITGKKDLLDLAWTMFESIKKSTETEHAFSSITTVLSVGTTVKTDSMEVRNKTCIGNPRGLRNCYADDLVF